VGTSFFSHYLGVYDIRLPRNMFFYIPQWTWLVHAFAHWPIFESAVKRVDGPLFQCPCGCRVAKPSYASEARWAFTFTYYL